VGAAKMGGNTGNARTISLPGSSRCELVRGDGHDLTFRFAARSNVLTPIRWEFSGRQDLVEYVAQTLSLEVTGDGVRGKVVRYGKYDRQGPNGERAFTFGDPVLDLITDPTGEMVVAGRRINLAASELGSPRYRSGGIRGIDLAMLSDSLRSYQLVRAAAGQGDHTIVEMNNEVVALASTNPSVLDFYRNGDHLRFKAWKKSFGYWSMGAEIETWGHDFTSARIESRYLGEAFAQTCTVWKVDSDSDTNDDYVDEYEWGISSPQPIRVESTCEALWHGENFRGLVTAGPTCFEV
jgi:hypothetical protein